MNDDQQPNGLRILFADDEESLQNVMSMELPRMGHHGYRLPGWGDRY